MKSTLRNILLATLIVPLLVSWGIHKFYVSVTHVHYAEKEQALQITTRIFIDDLEKILEERYNLKVGLATDTESAEGEVYIEKYFKTKFSIAVDGQELAFDYLGKQYDNDVVICYLEIPEVYLEGKNTVAVNNEILTDLFDEQQNVVHLKINAVKKSF
ncbi:MAG: DUF6702 family protein, partial [Bacteroidota bacterium]